MKSNRKRTVQTAVVFTFVVTVAVALTVVLTGCSGTTDNVEGAAGNSVQPVAVRVEQPRNMTLERRIPYVGTVFARQEVPIIARVQGTLVELPVREGEAFTAGTVLARLDSPEMEAAVNRLKADVDYWTGRLETDRRLVDQGALAPEQADSSLRAFRTASAGLDEARAQLAKTVVTAPFNGTVLDWPAEIGQPIMPGQPLILIGDAAREIKVDVIEEDLARGIAVGTPVDLQLSPGATVTSRVAAVSPASTGRSRTFTVTIPVPKTESGSDSGSESVELARKGASIRTEFIIERQVSTVAVPTRAVADRDGSPHLFVISDGRAARRDVVLGISQGGWIAADFGWNGTDPVAVTNVSGLSDGAAVYAVAAEGSK
ncbi:MAG: efflux RND transporter periplasmic adaptor subunit [Alkalispirochaeta sp.]